ncbi:BgtAc-31447 [Blumeria graminis f. sp. tritici]|uniref:BgtAc-31447 n=3 Tax=Blumeria graminis TaxID=34373 RepID=A0A9X9QEP6_BLUGR|nr:hypothetical protein BGT96224_Ac31447 [Blumeria graminis f. sp. tritici 96224]VDB91327.1 BgtAc-31447 [Blumeria graminis f. sp. tritici]
MMDNNGLFNFNFVTNGDQPQLYYYGERGIWTSGNPQLKQALRELSYSQFNSKDPGVSWGKFCASTEEQLLVAHQLIDAEVSRQRSIHGSMSLDMNVMYRNCVNELQTVKKKNPYISISRVMNGEWPSCTVKLLLRYIDSENLEILAPTHRRRRIMTNKPAVIGDRCVTSEELLDSSRPVLSLRLKNRRIHLVHVSGYLKVLEKSRPGKYYQLAPSLGHESTSYLFKMFEAAEREIYVRRSPSLQRIKIPLPESRSFQRKTF